MRIKFASRRAGLVALEAVVAIPTARGQTEEVVVHRRLRFRSGSAQRH